MFQNNPLLAQLKQQLHDNAPKVEGTVRATDKNYGFLEVDDQKSYFIPPPQMKKVMHGDRITARIQQHNGRELVEPETLVEPFLSRFVGRIQKNDKRFYILPDIPGLKEPLPCKIPAKFPQQLENGDWVVAELRKHPLRDDHVFLAEVTKFITNADDHFVPWWVTLDRNKLERDAPQFEQTEFIDDVQQRQDLTEQFFITIDSASTEDMDDAIYAEPYGDNAYQLLIAIADPTAYIPENSPIDVIAQERAFTNYLPGFNIPMLPRILSDNLCSLRPHEKRAALICRVIINADGSLSDDINFFSAWIISKAKLVYDNVSDWLEKTGEWQPDTNTLANQLTLLHNITKLRLQWRQQHALVFKDRPDYQFELNEFGDVTNIHVEPRRIANRLIEEAMITANICAAQFISKHSEFGIFNIHAGFDPQKAEALMALLRKHNIEFDAENFFSMPAFCQIKRKIDQLPTDYLDIRIRKFLSYVDISFSPQPHFGLGLSAYATWTSPIRKYGDMINHRIIKAIINQTKLSQPSVNIIQQMNERRRLNRIAEREVSDWLYIRYLAERFDENTIYTAIIFDVGRGGIRAKLLENGANIFIPLPFIHSVREELLCNAESGQIFIKGEMIYQLGDSLPVKLAEIRKETRSIIARPVINHQDKKDE